MKNNLETPLYKNPAKLPTAPFINEFQQKTIDNVSHTISTPKSWPKSNSTSPNISYKTTSTFSPNKVDYVTNSTRLAASPSINGGVKNANNPLRIAYKNSTRSLVYGTNKVANFAKSNFINPYPNAQLNTIDILLGKWIERDYETAKKTGGLIIPKIIRATTIGSYLGKWLDTTLMSTLIPDLAWKTRQVLNNTFIPPISWTFNRLNNVYKKGKKLILPEEMYRKSIENKKNRKEKFNSRITAPISRLKNWVNKKISFIG